MSYSGTVKRTVDIEFVFREGTDTENLAVEFSEYMWPVSESELIDHILIRLALGDNFIEGVGRVKYDSLLTFDEDDVEDEIVILYRTDFDETEVD